MPPRSRPHSSDENNRPNFAQPTPSSQSSILESENATLSRLVETARKPSSQGQSQIGHTARDRLLVPLSSQNRQYTAESLTLAQAPKAARPPNAAFPQYSGPNKPANVQEHQNGFLYSPAPRLQKPRLQKPSSLRVSGPDTLVDDAPGRALHPSLGINIEVLRSN
jgi:hypothetical protein